ncbi:Uncharacterised protein [Streptococcus criceti]|nr:Uncharacterised protein [Streptococcus criceti]
MMFLWLLQELNLKTKKELTYDYNGKKELTTLFS